MRELLVSCDSCRSYKNIAWPSDEFSEFGTPDGWEVFHLSVNKPGKSKSYQHVALCDVCKTKDSELINFIKRFI